ncbi:LiaF transmembrane domain-containing protein [Natronosalvus rutilus]|uniref:Cell wall-active antibiotics response protein n=1 Tax=Natronosalvus rutilus TaxID=2953753 RepID=A0A9E7NB65_9EURY|nr:LiaF domain-containing protein [Natronosalvus rutilus]UTF53738.1 cell wall-active antibiotics response protein [Natronosalvus rutilus]
MGIRTTTTRLPTSQLLFGAVVILVGLLLLLETTGLVSTDRILSLAPMVVVAVGVWALVRSRFRNVVGPLVLIGIASAWQLVALGYAAVDQVVVFWPLLVIAFGLSVVLGQYRSRVRATDDAFTSAFAAFGGVEKRNTSTAFTGADLTALFGGTELDLRDARPAERPARVNAVAMFGGVEIIVPRDWNVELDVLPVLGGASDDRPRRERQHEEVDLVVTGFAAFGAVSVAD